MVAHEIALKYQQKYIKCGLQVPRGQSDMTECGCAGRGKRLSPLSLLRLSLEQQPWRAEISRPCTLPCADSAATCCLLACMCMGSYLCEVRLSGRETAGVNLAYFFATHPSQCTMRDLPQWQDGPAV